MVRGKRCVMIEEAELRRLERQARWAEPSLPPLPAADAKGNRPALDYIQFSIARDVIKQRKAPDSARRSWPNWPAFGKRRSPGSNRASIPPPCEP